MLVGGTLKLPRHDYDPYDAEYANPAKLHAAGVTVAIHSKSGASTNETAARNLPFEAATAVAFGLPEEVALKSVTLTPAQILGSPIRSARWKPANAPTWSSRRATSSSRRPRYWLCSSTASRFAPRAATPGCMPNTGTVWTRSARPARPGNRTDPHQLHRHRKRLHQRPAHAGRAAVICGALIGLA